MFRCVSVLVLIGLCFTLAGCSNQTSVTAPVVKRSKDHGPDHSSPLEKISALKVADQTLNNTVSVFSGEVNSTYSRTIDGLSEILSHSQMRLRPIASQGPVWMRDFLGMSDDVEGIGQSVWIGRLRAPVGQLRLGLNPALHNVVW